MRRQVGLFSAVVLVVANMMGTGIFTTSGFVMAELQRPGALMLCWGLGALFALCGALCYGELGARFPRAGGEYVYLRESFGRPVAFLSGWVSLIVGFSAPIAAAAMAFAAYFFRTFSISAEQSHAVHLFGIPVVSLSLLNLTAVGVIAVFTLLHLHSVQAGRRVQNLLTVFKVVLVAGFIIGGFWLGDGGGHGGAGSPPPPLTLGAFAVSLVFVSFAYSGWNAAAYLGAEIVSPRRNIPLALFLGTALVAVLYLLLNLLYLWALPVSDMSGVLDIGAKAATGLFGGGISRYFSGAVALGLLSVLSAMVMTGPRVYYAMARDGVFFRAFAQVNPGRRTPSGAILLQAAMATVMVLSASFETLLIYIGFTLSLFSSLTVLGLMRIRMRAGKGGLAYKTWGYPVTPLLFILCNVLIIAFSLKNRPVGALAGLGTIAVGWLAYRAVFRPRRREGGRSYARPAAETIGVVCLLVFTGTCGWAHGVAGEVDVRARGCRLVAMYDDGTPMCYAAVEIMAPDSKIAFQRGRADRNGRFMFAPDGPGTWHAVFEDGMGHRLALDIETDAAAVSRNMTDTAPPGRAGERGRWQQAVAGLSVIFGLSGIAYAGAAHRRCRSRKNEKEA